MLPAVLAVAWLVPALPLLLAHQFRVVPMLAIAIPLAAGLCFLAFRYVRPYYAAPWWPVAATVAVAVVFAAWQVWMHTEQVIYLRDPATYLQTGYWIAHHGSLPVPQDAAAFGHANVLSFASSNYYPRGTGIVPQFMTGFPAVLAAAIWAGGIPGALVITPLIGGCAVLCFGGLTGRLIGVRWAPVGSALLALGLPELYVSRASFSEPLAQVLLFCGLSLVADGMGGPRGARWAVAGIAGLALGLTVFVRLDGLSDILPAVPFLALLAARRSLRGRRGLAVPFGLGLALGVAYGVADGYLLSRPYLDLEAPSLRPLGAIIAATVVLTVIAFAAATRPGVRRFFTAAKPALDRWAPRAVAGLTVLVFAGFAVRPLVQKVDGETNQNSISYVAALQKLAHLPIDGKDQYYQDSLYWVIWYIGVPAVILGACGLAWLANKTVRGLLESSTEPDTEGDALRWALPLGIALWVIVTVLWRPAVAPDQPWASRRLTPFVLPGILLGATWLVAKLHGLTRSRGTGSKTVAAVAIAALAIPSVWTTFGISVTPRLTSHGMAFKRIGHGELNAVTRLCQAMPKDASVIILDQITSDRFAQVIRGECGVPAATLANPVAASVTQAVQATRNAGRRPVLIADQQATLAAYTGEQTRVVNLRTTQEAHVLTASPTRTWVILYTVWLGTP